MRGVWFPCMALFIVLLHISECSGQWKRQQWAVRNAAEDILDSTQRKEAYASVDILPFLTKGRHSPTLNALSKQLTPVFEETGSDSMDKRVKRCDTTRMTINTIIEYLTTGKVCGNRVAKVRFGMGK